MSDELEIVRHAESATEADLIQSLLHEAGIESVQEAIAGPEFAAGGHTVSVAPADLERAREVLAANEHAVSDEELARLSEQAGREQGPAED
jgi:transcriptional/translational regulatory protein YebC/TACO1